MLQITRGTNNTLILTLTEKTTLVGAKYLVKMVSRSSRGIKRFILPSDQSSFTDRFNKFTLTETSGTEILTSGTVTLQPTGWWEYDIYEQLSSTNLDETKSDNKVAIENGLARITGTEDINKFYDAQNTEGKFYGTGNT